MPSRHLTNFETQKYYQNEPKFNGVYSRNNLPKIKYGTYVINLDEFKLIGTHWIHINHLIGDRLKNGIEQLKGKILESITSEEFHLVENIHENSYNKSFDLTKKRHIRKFDELFSKNEVTQSATNITDKKKRVINMSSRQ